MHKQNVASPLPSIVKPWMIQSFLTFDSMNRTLKCVFFNFGKFVSFGRGTHYESFQSLRGLKGFN